jgi:hypothetical protein
MLTDHRTKQERWAWENRERRGLPRAHGNLITDLGPWHWFLTFTFRDSIAPFDPPTKASALRRIEEYFRRIQTAAGHPIGWVIAEEFGRWGGKYHCHALLKGVADLPRDLWRRVANRRFGITEIERFNPTRGAAYYTAKYAGRFNGEIHYGGTLKGVDLSRCVQSRSQGGGQDMAISVPLTKDYFRMTCGRWHR